MGETSYNEEDAKKFEWELCRENVKPMKHGRRVDAINKALSKVECNAERVASEKLEECFATAESAEDPLELCLGFCRWFVDSYPSGKQRLYYQLLWKIVHKFIEKSRYEHDPRSLKIWESLADNSLGHGYEVYQYAYHKGCLTENADFYIRWARDLEDRGAIQNAREVLHRGRLQGAMPLNILVDEEDQLEMREMRRQLDRVKTSDDQESDDDWDNDENGETRQVFTRMSSLDDGAVPVMRLPSLVGEQGSRKLADVPKSQLQSTAFDVFEDDEKAQENYLEDIYQIHSEAHSSHIERYALKNNNTIKLAPTKNPKKTHSQSTSSFAIWSDDKENVDPNDEVVDRPSASKGLQKKPKLAFQKKFLEVAMEEIMAERYFADEAVRKRLTFDDTDED